eukprot:TRINITY_DN95401_c0_g1_i1.p1 TRINITY_DN95401_c0_g1~~TRINITY_DN95401_c0_g1_i1.p1  ORF type:complete len:284 (-),score=36.02 TRINITY_DN95401_c0_g1_i1:27-878(-)
METLPEADRERFTQQSKRLEVAKSSAEFFGRRPRRFSVMCLGEGVTEMPPGAKRIHFIRHGEGEHNVWRAAEFKAGRKPYAKRNNIDEVPPGLFDPRLTEVGRSEAKKAQEKTHILAPELLVTSPLRRAVETLLLGFEAAVGRGIPCIAHELCREEIKGTPPGEPSIYDAHLPRSVLATEFPQVDFTQYVLPPEEGPEGEMLRGDPIWWHCASPVGPCRNGENDAAMCERAWCFLCWLMSRQEKEIAVATHSIFLIGLFHGALDPPQKNGWKELQIFRTGELR